MSGRRGILAGLAALAGGAATMGRGAIPRALSGRSMMLHGESLLPQTVAGEAWHSGGKGYPTESQPYDSISQATWNLFHRKRRREERSQQRMRIARELVGGWPPHIAVMQSNAVWFRAQRAAVWIQAQEDRNESVLDQLRVTILGHKPTEGDW